MMMYASFVIACNLTPRLKNRFLHILARAAVAGVIMTAWDLVMDPLMVAGGHWVWEIPGTYFGIPLHNYLGWWFTTFVTIACFLFLWPRQRSEQQDKNPLPATWDRWVYLSYLITAVGNGAAAAIVGLTGPALVGFFAMLPWLLFAMWKNSSPREKLPQ
jgi:putative membrane protein